jgi:hypothetical protein
MDTTQIIFSLVLIFVALFLLIMLNFCLDDNSSFCEKCQIIVLVKGENHKVKLDNDDLIELISVSS